MKSQNVNWLILLTMVFVAAFCVKWVGTVAAKGELENVIESLEVGDPVYYENLTIIPIYNTKARDGNNYATLDEALGRNWLEITEVYGGTVPKVRITNHSNTSVFIMGGEILSGGRQDRIVGRDVLIGPRSRNVIVPVYCTEQGRWNEQSRNFYSKKNLGTWNMRAAAQHAGPSTQSDIWGHISSSSGRMGIKSNTSAYQSLYEDTSVRRRIEQHETYLRNIPQLERDTVGVVIGVGGNIVSVDIFANPDLFRELWPKILKSASLSSIDSSRSGSISQRDAIQILRRIHDASYRQKSAVDLGVELSAYNNGVNANALLYRGALLHLAAFPAGYDNIRTKNNWNNDRRIPVIQRRY
ncbi:MAG: hypothetical protein Q8Q08_04755 [Candidatus Omnitrophota bacterium]|nr:hypothetical protein [Candidatus Omnitrophota bacterium]MDZ4242227.1 DUF6569 family protein [Candidatus Omnitrophota bacterium]